MREEKRVSEREKEKENERRRRRRGRRVIGGESEIRRE